MSPTATAQAQTAPCPDPMAPPSPNDPARYFGKYRGVVLDNIDPLVLGRILPEVPQIPGSLLNWAMPCVPYAGPLVGFYAIPPIGANVWIEFEGGNPNFPIWAGCFWLEAEFPFAAALDPLDPALVKIWKTETITLILNDTPQEGGVLLEVTPPTLDVPATIALNVAGLEINYGVNTIVIQPEEGITASVTETVVAMTEAAIEINSTEINVTAANLSVEAASEFTGNVEITGAVEIEGNVEVTGAVEIEGNVEVTGATEIVGDLSVTGATEMVGDLALAGAAEIGGDVAIAGAVELAGNLAVVGAVEIVGDLVAPVIEGVLFGAVIPPF
jgi:cytoskeletal protein CcmA (bactofilin family)